jgi:hypothetical protein
MRLPKLLVSSVVRGASQGDSHGGLYLVDIERGAHEQLLDWNDGSINFEGRGADRGLRGIAVCGDAIFVAASDELFAFDRSFRVAASYRNPYLRHCHEIWPLRGKLFLASTGFDSILRFDLERRRFDLGIRLTAEADRYGARFFDPEALGGPGPSLALHLNNVYADDYGVFAAGLKMPALLQITPHDVSVVAEIPLGAHNARPYRGGVILNDTDNDRLVWFTASRQVMFDAPRYPEQELLNAGADVSGIARQAFGRGLCFLSDMVVAAGSSPTTVSVYDLKGETRLASINLTMDVRNAAHGMAVYPG